MGKNIAITGGSSQIGRAIIERVFEPGDTIVIQCLKGENSLSDIKLQYKNSCEIVKADFTVEADRNAFCERLTDIDVLINAAALTVCDLCVNLSDEDIHRMLQVNILSTIASCKKALPGMIAKRKGIIVNISSITATRGNRGQSVYAGTKGFIESFTRCIAAEYGPRGIRANCVAPGAIEAGSLLELMEYAGTEVKNANALKHTGAPKDVAAMTAFLCSDGASFISGKTFGVDGGFLLGI